MKRISNTIYDSVNLYNKSFLIRMPNLKNFIIERTMVYIYAHTKKRIITFGEGSADSQIIFKSPLEHS